MHEPETTKTLVNALSAVPPYDDPLQPIAQALSQSQPLTLRTIAQHSQLLHDCEDTVRAQTAAVQGMIHRCQTLPAIPLPSLPHGF